MSSKTFKYLWSIKILFLFPIVNGDAPFSEVLHRGRRQFLLFPNVTLLQCNIGVGTPTPNKQINVNWAIQTNFNLPWNLTQIPLDILHANSGYVGSARKERDKTNDEEEKGINGYMEEVNKDRYDSYDGSRRKREDNTNGEEKRIDRFELYDDEAKLHHFYKFVEDVLDGFGYDGTSCVLQTICQLAAEPLHSDAGEDLLHEIASYISNPTNTISNDSMEEEAYPYIEAYHRGKAYQDCTRIFDCRVSMVDWFSQVAD